MSILNGKLKYLMLIPVIVCIAFSLYFYNLENAIMESLLNEKFKEKQEAVEMIAYQLDEFIAQDNDWESEREYYVTSLRLSTEKLDTTYMTYAAVFNEDLSLASKHLANEDSSFNPMDFLEFRNAVKQNETGDLTLDFKAPGEARRDVLVYYKWIPTSPDLESRYLVVVGISRLTVVTHIAGWVSTGAIALIASTTILNGAMLWFLTSRKYLYGTKN